MTRRRLGIVVELPDRCSLKVEGVREIFGYRGVSRIDPHITVVAPFNLSVSAWPDLRRRCLEVTGEAVPFRVRIGEAMTFEPASSVLVLRVEDLDGGLELLRSRLLAAGELIDHPERDFRPHVTLADGLEPSDVSQLLDLVGGVDWTVEVDSISILERPDRPSGARWRSIVRPMLGESRRVVRGPLALSLVTFALLESGPLGAEVQPGLEPGSSFGSVGASSFDLVEGDREGLREDGLGRTDLGVVVGAYVGSDEVGRAVAERTARGIYSLTHVEVSAVEHRGSGVGRAIFDHLREYLERQGGRFVISRADTALDPFLTSLGFDDRNETVLSDLEDHYGTMLKVRSFSIR